MKVADQVPEIELLTNFSTSSEPLSDDDDV